jgi:hypothetical protein
MDRRTTIKWVMAASTAWPLLKYREAGADPTPPARGYGSDPNLAVNYHAGELWPLTLTDSQRHLAGILCDIIIPADELSPSASAAGVVDFIDEWLSAPYPDYQRDRGIVLGGFAWLDTEAQRRFGRDFVATDSTGQIGICDDVCHAARAASGLRDAANFFARFRDLTAAGFYSSPIGRKDLSYIGNVPQASFEGPSPALLKSLGLA